MLAPLIMMVAPNGARRGYRDHPAIPLTATQLARCARDCCELGVPALHLHVRTAQGEHTLDVATYRHAIAAVRREVKDQIVLQVTSDAVGRYSASEQMAMIRALRPEAVSVALRELLPESSPDEGTADEFFQWCRREGVALQYILYDQRDGERFRGYWRRGLIPSQQPAILWVLGRKTEPPSPPELAPAVVNRLRQSDPAWRWMLCAFDSLEYPALLASAAVGGDVRLGFENNLRLADGRWAQDNAELVQQLLESLRWLPRPLAGVDEVRRRWEML